MKMFMTGKLLHTFVSLISQNVCLCPRIALHTTRALFGLSWFSLRSIPSSPLRLPSRQKSTIPTLMRRARSACRSSVQRTGSQPQKLTRVRRGPVVLMSRLYSSHGGCCQRLVIVEQPLQYTVCVCVKRVCCKQHSTKQL